MKYLLALVLTIILLLAMYVSNAQSGYIELNELKNDSIQYGITMNFPDSSIVIQGDTSKAIRSLFKALIDCQSSKIKSDNTIGEYFVIPTGARDTVPKAQLTDTTKFLSLQDIQKYSEPLKDRFSARQFEDWVTITAIILANARKDWEEKQNKKP